MSDRGQRRVRVAGANFLTCLCGKAYSPTKEAAKGLRLERWGRGGDPCRYYECEHGGWHWTRYVRRSFDGVAD